MLPPNVPAFLIEDICLKPRVIRPMGRQGVHPHHGCPAQDEPMRTAGPNRTKSLHVREAVKIRIIGGASGLLDTRSPDPSGIEDKLALIQRLYGVRAPLPLVLQHFVSQASVTPLALAKLEPLVIQLPY